MAARGRGSLRVNRAALFVTALTAAIGCSVVSSPEELTGGAGRGGTGTSAGAAGNPAGGRAGAAGSSGVGATSGGAGSQALGGSGGNAGSGGPAGGSTGSAAQAGAAGTAGAAGALGGGGAGAGGAGAGGGGNAGSGGASAGEGGAGQAAAGQAGTAGGGGQPSSPTGAIVMGGVATTGQQAKNVLVVLDPKTGKELSRETMQVAAIAHESTATDDRWFIFESEGFVEPAPNDTVNLHIRKLDLATGAWENLAKVKVPPMVIGSVVVLNNRLAYLGYGPGGSSQRRVVLLDTSAKLGEISLPAANTFDTASAAGLLGVPNTTGAGGTLDVVGVTAAPCTANGGGNSVCEVTLMPITVDGTGATFFQAKKALSFPYSAGAQAAWAASPVNNEIYIAFPAKAPESPFVRRFSPAGVTALGQPFPFDASGSTFRSMAFDDCSGVAFLTELNADQAVFAIPTKKPGAAGVQSLGKPGQRVLYERTTHSALVPFSQGGTFSLRAFTVDASTTPPSLTERTAATWAPPPDVAPGPIAVRAGVANTCD